MTDLSIQPTAAISVERFERLEDAVVVLEKIVAQLMPAPKPQDDFGGDLTAWVDGWLLPRLERPVSTGGGAGIYWCSHWRDHPEAVARLEALRDAWTETTVGTAGALAAWWVEKADPTLRLVLAADGPFTRCRETHRRLSALHTEPEEE
jgi:hypothetical protein